MERKERRGRRVVAEDVKEVREFNDQIEIISFEGEGEGESSCVFCLNKGSNGRILVSGCTCAPAYHEICMLRWIRNRLLEMNSSVNLGKICCWKCKQQIFFSFRVRQQYRCRQFCRKLKRNCCETFLCLIVVDFALIGLTVFLFELVKKEKAESNSIFMNILNISLLVALILQLLLFLIFLGLLIHRKLRFIEIILISIIPPPLSRGSNDSDDLEIACENIKIHINSQFN